MKTLKHLWAIRQVAENSKEGQVVLKAVVAQIEEAQTTLEALQLALPRGVVQSLSKFCDARPREEVLELIDRAIARKNREVIAPTLIAAMAKIQSGWVKNIPAVDARGFGKDPRAFTATCWCITGGLQAVATGDLQTYAKRALVKAGDLDNDLISLDEILQGFNDHPETTKEDVINLFQKALTDCGTISAPTTLKDAT